MRLLRTVNQFSRKMKKRSSSEWQPEPINLNKLRDRVYLKIMEDCDDPALVSNETLVQICLLLDEFQFDTDQAHIVKEVYNQILARGIYFTPLQIS
jgi:hypothetical protein